MMPNRFLSSVWNDVDMFYSLETRCRSPLLNVRKWWSIFLLGDTGWLLFSKLNRKEAQKYLENRAEKGFNIIQVMVFHEFKAVNFYSDSALVNRDASTPKLLYLSKNREIVQHLAYFN